MDIFSARVSSRQAMALDQQATRPYLAPLPSAPAPSYQKGATSLLNVGRGVVSIDVDRGSLSMALGSVT